MSEILSSTGKVINGETYVFQFQVESKGDGDLIGAYKEDGEGNTTQIDPTSSEWMTVTSSAEALLSYNQVVNESNDEISSITTEANFEELNNHFETENKKNLNEETDINDQNDDNIGTEDVKTAYAAYKQSRGKKVGTDIYTYPLDIDPLQDHLKISKYQYQRPITGIQGSLPPRTESVRIQSQLTEGRNGQERVTQDAIRIDVDRPGSSMRGMQLEGSVLLPMPKVVDTNGAEWGDSELNIVALAAASFTGNLLGISKESLAGMIGDEDSKLRNLVKDIRDKPDKTSNFGSIKDAISSSVASEAAIRGTGQTVSADELLARAQGTVLNPNAELLFQGPVLRDFNFDFLMVARSQSEGKEIRKIIRWFKTGMAPQFQDATLLKTPDIFTLEYKRGQSDMDILDTVNRFNPGGLALRTFAVDYAPNGYWSAYRDSQPVALKMSLNFAELRPIYKRDQEMTPESSVGY